MRPYNALLYHQQERQYQHASSSPLASRTSHSDARSSSRLQSRFSTPISEGRGNAAVVAPDSRASSRSRAEASSECGDDDNARESDDAATRHLLGLHLLPAHIVASAKEGGEVDAMSAAKRARVEQEQRSETPMEVDDANGDREKKNTYLLLASEDHSIVIGRVVAPTSSPTTTTEIQPASLSTHTQLGSKPVLNIGIPASIDAGRHVSRTHAVLEFVAWGSTEQVEAKVCKSVKSLAASAGAGAEGNVKQAGKRGMEDDEEETAKGVWVIRILGQNGLIVDGKRRKGGQVFRINPASIARKDAQALFDFSHQGAAAAAALRKEGGEEGALFSSGGESQRSIVQATELDFFGVSIRLATIAAPTPSIIQQQQVRNASMSTTTTNITRIRSTVVPSSPAAELRAQNQQAFRQVQVQSPIKNAPPHMPSVASKEELLERLKEKEKEKGNEKGKKPQARMRNGMMTPPTSSSPLKPLAARATGRNGDGAHGGAASGCPASTSLLGAAAPVVPSAVVPDSCEEDSSPEVSANKTRRLPMVSGKNGDKSNKAHSAEEEDEEGDEDAHMQSPTSGRGHKRDATASRRGMRLSKGDSEREKDASSEEEDAAPVNKRIAALARRSGTSKAFRVEETQMEESEASEEEQEEDEDEEEGQSDSDDDLTPPPSPSQPAPKRVAPAAARARNLSSGGKNLSDPQTRMPPPALPAALRRTAAASDAAALSRSSPTPEDDIQRAARDRARKAVRLLARTYDLEGLLAGVIVFHRTATIGASEAVRGVLANNAELMRGEAGDRVPAHSSPEKRRMQVSDAARAAAEAEDVDTDLMHGKAISLWTNPFPDKLDSAKWSALQRKAWTEHLQLLLRECPMFGSIDRAGKDVSGNALEAWYYYDHERDHDRDRATNLKQFVKPIRGALKTLKVSQRLCVDRSNWLLNNRSFAANHLEEEHVRTRRQWRDSSKRGPLGGGLGRDSARRKRIDLGQEGRRGLHGLNN